MEYCDHNARREFTRPASPLEQLTEANLAAKIRTAIDANRTGIEVIEHDTSI